VADYLYRESLVQQPEEIQRFLLCTSVLDQLSGPLCEAVLESSRGSANLRRIEASSLFLIPLDRRREWYRYHALFREFLIGELRRTEPEVIETLHLRAAGWYESHRSPPMALEHLLATAERQRAAELTAEVTLATYQAGRMSTVQRWLAALGDRDIAAYPPLAVLAGWLSVLTGDPIGAERWAAVVDAASFNLVPRDGSASLDSARAMLRGVMCATGPEAMIADASFAVAAEPAWSPWRDTALWELGEAHLLAGDVEQARCRFAESSTHAVTMDNTDSIIACESELALLAMEREDWSAAEDHLTLALATIDDKRMHEYPLSLLAFAVAARLALHNGEPDEAERQLGRAMRARPAATYAVPFVAVRLRLVMAKAYLALSERRTARHLLREIDEILTHRPRLGCLIDEVDLLRPRVADTADAAKSAAPLTRAELRILPYLQTHLTFNEIGTRLYVSHHTVATHVHAIYRKLGVSSRSAAVQHATAVGLLGG
jgi:LuxR family maltose regulon positive regulatory protein